MPKFLILLLLASSLIFVISQPPLDPAEQETVYRLLESVNPAVPWRTLFPDDLCTSAPHGVVCGYSSDEEQEPPHVTELSFGYVSDYSPNPPCDPGSTLGNLPLFPLSHLRKLFLYKCFTAAKTQLPDLSPLTRLEELVFVENPALVGTLDDGKIGSLGKLRRLVLTGNGFSGGIHLSGLTDLEELTLSRNNFSGEIPVNIFQNATKLRILDLSHNQFAGAIPASAGNSTELLKIDLSSNGFSGKIPETLRGLKKLEFLDLSHNNLGGFGLPLFLSEMSSLKEVYLSGNSLGGQIPEIWGDLRGISGIGLSGVGLVGNIPRSMGVHLKNLCYLGLNNNALEGVVPSEFGDLELLSELNLENNRLSGRVPFSVGFVSKIGVKLKVEDNLDLCIDEGLKSFKAMRRMKVCRKPLIPQAVFPYGSSSSTRIEAWFFGIFVHWVVLVLFPFWGLLMFAWS